MNSDNRKRWFGTLRWGGAAAIVLVLIGLLVAVERGMAVRGAKRFERDLADMGVDLNWRAQLPREPAPEENFYGALVVRAWLPPKGSAASVEKDEEAPPKVAVPPGWFSRLPVSVDELAELPRDENERSLSALSKYFDQFDTSLQMLREAAKRPYVYLPGNYGAVEGFPVPNYVALRVIAQTLATRARVHLLLGCGDRAIEDLDTIEALMRGTESRPTLLVSAMIRVAVAGLYLEVVRDGFNLEVWQPRELVALRARLEKMELIAPVVDSLVQGELIGACDLLTRMAEGRPRERIRFLKYLGFGDELRTRLLSFVPASSVRQNLLLAAGLFKEATETFAKDGSRYYPKKMAHIAERMNVEFTRRRLDNVFAASFVPNFSKASVTCAKNQTRVRLAIIACALEQYRAIHGGYPERLEDLESADRISLPRDLVSGALPVYRQSRARYQLYSVGEDEEDDGGTALDWVW